MTVNNNSLFSSRLKLYVLSSIYVIEKIFETVFW